MIQSLSKIFNDFIYFQWNLIFNLFSRQRIPKKQWWLKLRPLLRILAKHDSAYEEEGMYLTVEEECANDANVV